ncbi:MAG: class II fructose-bisphosphate aldolase [Patescibacteria group bacterium]|jgi:ketose-bisphosphate aldolase|nr:class II fructose-bisphosphate aldolase [Patescibacteria group bacterium]
MLVTTKDLYLDAKKEGYAIGAFNVSTLEAIKAIINAAMKLKSPVVIETSEKEMSFLEPALVFDIVKELAKDLRIPVGLHLDHGKSLETVKEAIASGYTSVHFDGSGLPDGDNIKLTKAAAEMAHQRNLTIEGELGHIAGSSEMHGEQIIIDKKTLTDPEMAKKFVSETGIDILAVSVGNIHGIYKNEPKLDIERLAKIKEIGIPMSLHGGSGIPDDQIKRAISCGIAKINVNTELRMAYTETLRDELAENPDEIVPYEYLPEEIEAIEDVVEAKIRLFGSDNRI